VLVSFALYRKEKIITVAKYYEDLEEFVEELKKLNPRWIDRREFTIRCKDEIIRSWQSK
jgi:hypothetical protein